MEEIEARLLRDLAPTSEAPKPGHPTSPNRPQGYIDPAVLDGMLLDRWMADVETGDADADVDGDSVELTVEEVLRTKVTATEQVMSTIALGGFLWAAAWVALYGG